jgi:hypothetical protein
MNILPSVAGVVTWFLVVLIPFAILAPVFGSEPDSLTQYVASVCVLIIGPYLGVKASRIVRSRLKEEAMRARTIREWIRFWKKLFGMTIADIFPTERCKYCGSSQINKTGTTYDTYWPTARGGRRLVVHTEWVCDSCSKKWTTVPDVY